MNDMKHTPEPWLVNQGIVTGAIGDNGVFIAVTDLEERSFAEAKANAARIVACVNACAGISNEALSLGGPFAAAKAAIVQRDELATALRAVLRIADRKHDAFDAAHSALAKVQP